MEQRIKKIKLFRALKVVYYCLGMPLFLLAVMALVSQLYGHLPFGGNPGDGLLDAIKVFFNSPAMYSVWIALGIWLVIGLIQIVCGHFIKNRHSRMLVVVASMLVILLVPIFVIDAIYTAKVNDLREEYGISADTKVDTSKSGIVIKDYSEQLSYYHTHTGGGEANGKKTSLTDTLIESATNFCNFYNVPFYGEGKTSVANNFTNRPLFYDELGFDYDGNGAVDEYDHIIVANTFDTSKYTAKNDRFWFSEITLKSKDGSVTETVKGNFFCRVYGQPIAAEFGSSEVKTVSTYMWYDGDKGSFEATDGVYGSAFYNKNGLLSDGYIYSIDVALRILEDYYSAQDEMKAAYAAYTAAAGKLTEDQIKSGVLYGKQTNDDDSVTVVESAKDRWAERYTGADATDEDKALFARENAMAGQYSLTSAELNTILSVLGNEVGTAPLVGSLLGTIVNTFGVQLNFTLPTILGLFLSEDLAAWAGEALGMTDTSIAIGWSSTTSPEHPDQHLTITFSGGVFTTPVVLDLDETFALSQLTPVLEGLGISSAVLGEVLGLLGLNATGDNIDELISSLLGSLYWYTSPVLDPVFNYYANEELNVPITEESSNADKAKKALYDYQTAFAKYSRAEYEGGMHGYMIGSRLIGSSIGDGSFSADNGLTTLAAVKQLQIDLSYQPEMYSILIVRDMLMTFAAIILFFTVMSYLAADREILYATGKIELKGKKAKKEKKGKKDEETAEELPEETAALAEENNEEVR